MIAATGCRYVILRHSERRQYYGETAATLNRKMAQAQREAARNAGAAFWSTYEAMRSLGGMARFVQNGWAGKDLSLIHI